MLRMEKATKVCHPKNVETIEAKIKKKNDERSNKGEWNARTKKSNLGTLISEILQNSFLL